MAPQPPVEAESGVAQKGGPLPKRLPGSGNFSARASYVVANGAPRSTIGDFNGDGALDIAVDDEVNGNAAVLINRGDGTFNSVVTYAAGGYSFGVTSGDFNSDGVKDLVVTELAGTLYTLLGNRSDGVSALQPFSLKIRYDALQSMSYIASVQTRLNAQRGTIGAFQSRLIAATSNLSTATTVYAGAISAITDADVAEESARLTSRQIIQRAAASVLSQANLQPQIALKLLN